MTKVIPILSGRCLVVELPEGATNHHIHKKKVGSRLRYTLSNGINTSIELPQGNWRIIGMLSEVTEEQAAGMVEGGEIPFDETANAYRNYSYKSEWGAMWLSTALESLDSAILAEGWYFENPVKIHTWASENADDYRKQWEEGKKRILDRSRCLLLGRESN